MKVSMVLIARDEEENVVPCFESFWDAVDEVVLCDTGSEDWTVAKAETFADDRGEREKLIIGRFDWCDDFAAARTYAESLATGDWTVWADLDDTVYDLGKLRELAEQQPDIDAFYCAYEYALDERGNCICEHWRERLVRKGKGRWVDAIHESQLCEGRLLRVGKGVCRWTHRKPPFIASDRNTRMLEAWLEREPANPRALINIARDCMSMEKWKEAVPYYERYLQLNGQPNETRAQATRQLCAALMQSGQAQWAHSLALRSLGECPTWPDTYNTLAEIAALRGDWPQVVFFSEQVLRIGSPETLLIINPQDYEQRPKHHIAHALAGLGKMEDACELAEEILAGAPGFMRLEEFLGEWQAIRQRNQTAGMWAQCAQLLVNYDEPLKAEALLQTVPHYAWDEPVIVAARVAARRVAQEPYEVEKLDGARGAFLIRGLREQIDKAVPA